MKTNRSIFVFTSFALALTAVACSKQTASAPAPAVIRGVRLVQVTTQKMPETLEAVGTVRARESATLSAQIMGTVASVAVHEGDHVHAGQVLITIDAAQMASQVKQAHAAVATAEQQITAAESDAALANSTLRRYEQLKAQKSVSPQEFDEVETRAKAANARLAALHSQKAEATAAASSAATMQGYTRIRAPFDGMVTERRADPGAMAAPGVPLLTVEKAGALQLEATVDESLLAALKVGGVLPVMIPALGNAPIDGKVSRVVPAADPGSRSFVAKIDLPTTPGLYSGMFGRALVTRGPAREVVTVPRSAVVTHGSMQSVYVVGSDRIATLRYISTGSAAGDSLVVLSGLSAGESFVVAPGERELGGKRVEDGQ